MTQSENSLIVNVHTRTVKKPPQPNDKKNPTKQRKQKPQPKTPTINPKPFGISG